ncbi:hypothetical protein SAMD00019534_010950, partial [Acytostelium subglobosum LB1]|uniref:hypothetical protein n=1 Tax=Acytostelium subglobosum LB1 TaxID=1410327 RepID=UPI0006451329
CPVDTSVTDNHDVMIPYNVIVVEGKNLPAMDPNGKSDPFFVIQFAGEKVYKSEVIKKTLNPRWDESHNLVIRASQSAYTIKFDIWDWDKITSNDYIGEIELDVPALSRGTLDKWYPVKKKEKTDRGEIHLVSNFITKKEVYSAFWTSVCRHFSNNEAEDVLSLPDYTALITSVNSDFPMSEIETMFEKADLNGDGNISVSELEQFFSETEEGEKIVERLLDGNPDLIWETYAISDSYSTIADNIFSKSHHSSLKTVDNRKMKVINVHNRETGKLEEEKIPHYIEVAMRVMYSTKSGRSACNNTQVRRLLKFLTNKTGKKYAAADSVKDIPPFIKFHNLNIDEILEPLTSFKNFNEFFYRRLKLSARPIYEVGNPSIAVSPADARLHVFETLDKAKELWIKGKNFTLASLLQDEALASQYEGGSIVIARLAPQDYHRFHVPVDGVIGTTKHIDGEYFTVNPVAINQDIDVYTENKRSVTIIHSKCFDNVIFVSVGATMVGSINLLTTEGQHVQKGDEQGYFAFGGSTILLLFKKGTIAYDQDIVVNSAKPIETLVKVGTSLGRAMT